MKRFSPNRSPLVAWTASLLCVCAGAPAAVAATAAMARVHLVHGTTIDVSAYRAEGGQATLVLPDGGTIAFPATLVGRIETLPPDPASSAGPVVVTASPPAPAPAPPVSQAPPPVAPPAPDPAEKADSIDAMIRAAATRHGLEPELLAAVIAVESGFRADAVSPKGAQGLMQLMPSTARELAVSDPFNPGQNIDAGARYLRQLLDRHGDSFVDALAAYNAGAGRVARYKGLPPYRETVSYIGKVLARYRSLQPAVPSFSSAR